MERVVRNFVDLDVGPDIGPGPASQGVDLDQPEGGVPRHDRGVRPGGGVAALVPA